MPAGSVQLNGQRVTHASVTIPTYGTWTADVELASDVAVTGQVTLTIGSLSMVGTVFRSAVFAGKCSARIVAGAGGWRKSLPPRGYSQPAGVRLSVVLADAARESGETVALGADRVLGKFWTRAQHKASRVLKMLTSDVWYVDNAGVTQVRDRATGTIVSPFTVSKWDQARGLFEIATEAYQDWVPGRTFTTTTVTTPQLISSVTIDADNEGKVRLAVFVANSYRERLLSDFRAIVRSEILNLQYFSGTWDCTVAPTTSQAPTGTVDVTPKDTRLPPLTRVPLAPELGAMAAPVAGTTCRIRFVNQDPSRPECVGLAGTTEHLMTAEATALLIYNVAATFLAAFGATSFPTATSATIMAGAQPLLLAAITGALTAQGAPAPTGSVAQAAAAIVAAAAMVPGTAPSISSAPFSSLIATALNNKTPDVTGLFPSLGVPNSAG